MFATLAYDIAAADPDIWWFIGISGVLAVVGFNLFRIGLHRSRLIENIPRSLLRSAAQGYVELHGAAQLLPGEPILGRLTGKRCVWYKFAVEEQRRDSKGRTRWATVESGTSTDHFQLRDDTGICVVDPDGAEVIALVRDQWRGDSRWPSGAPASRSRWLNPGRYRYTESRLHEGDELFVLGNFRTQTLRLGTDAAVNALLHEWKLDQARLVRRFDTNQDGNIDGVEWEAARAAAAAEARQGQLTQAVAPPLNILDRPPEVDRPYVISAKPEIDLIRTYRRRLWVGIVLFVVCGAAFVWMAGIRLASP